MMPEHGKHLMQNKKLALIEQLLYKYGYDSDPKVFIERMQRGPHNPEGDIDVFKLGDRLQQSEKPHATQSC